MHANEEHTKCLPGPMIREKHTVFAVRPDDRRSSTKIKRDRAIFDEIWRKQKKRITNMNCLIDCL